jgi:hypothetical protein
MTVAGHDFWFMWGLAHRAYLADCTDSWVLQNFSPGLMIAISWEETQFNNIRQSGFTHIDWMKRWTDIDPATNGPRKNKKTGQASGNHAIGYVQVERDTMDRWLALNPQVCLGLPGFDGDMMFRVGDATVSPERINRRRLWWQTIDEKVLARDEAGFQLGWRTFSHMHTAGVANSKKSALVIYGGSNEQRDDPTKTIGRTASQIVQGWLDTDACLRAMMAISPYRSRVELGWTMANRMLAGAYYYSRPDGDFLGGFGGTTTAQALEMNRVFEKYLTRGPSDSFIETRKIDDLRADIKATLGMVEAT